MNALGRLVVRFLRRPAALETWRYERRVHLLVEAACLLVGVLVAPAGPARAAALVLAPLALWQAELSREAASADRRRREEDERRGVQRARLHCDEVVRRRDGARALVAWVWPALGALLPAVVAGSVVGPALGAVVASLVRLVRDRVAYPAWRTWWVRAGRGGAAGG